MSALGWHLPHLVDNIDTQYLGDQHWLQCWFFTFFFILCPSVCLCVSLWVCTSVQGQNSLCSNNQQLLALLDLCVVWWFCEIFAFCLPSHLLLFLPGCKQLHYSTTAVFQIIFQRKLLWDNILKTWSIGDVFLRWICTHRSNKFSFIRWVFSTAPRHAYSTLG